MAKKHKELTSEQYAALTYHKVIIMWVMKMEEFCKELQLMKEMSEDYLKNIGVDPKMLDPKNY